MAGLNPWLIASLAMLPALAIPLARALRGSIDSRLVAVELASTITALLLVCLSFAFAQPSFLDLAVTLALLSLPGTLVLAVFLERWL
ncbi:MAG TPA: monovalent cation/H+ antiporter complex subunit F [Acetobacteraceae bacterium]